MEYSKSKPLNVVNKGQPKWVKDDDLRFARSEPISMMTLNYCHR